MMSGGWRRPLPTSLHGQNPEDKVILLVQILLYGKGQHTLMITTRCKGELSGELTSNAGTLSWPLPQSPAYSSPA